MRIIYYPERIEVRLTQNEIEKLMKEPIQFNNSSIKNGTLIIMKDSFESNCKENLKEKYFCLVCNNEIEKSFVRIQYRNPETTVGETMLVAWCPGCNLFQEVYRKEV